MKNLQSQKGQTLIEAVVSVGLVTLVLVALVSAITFSLANAQFARNKAIATKYAQEAVEFLRKNRDASWATFYNNSDGTNNRPISTTEIIYCLPATTTGAMNDLLTIIAGNCSNITDTYGIFKRTVGLSSNGTISPNNNDRVNVNVIVSWSQGNRTPNVTVDTYLTKWQ